MTKRDRQIVAAHYAAEDKALNLARITNGKHPDYQNGTAIRRGAGRALRPRNIPKKFS